MADIAPTPLPGAKENRFSPRGVRETLWTPTIAGFNSEVPVILAAEIGASTDLSCAIQNQSGGGESTSFVETPDQCSKVNGKITDSVTMEDITITFYGDNTGEDAGDFFARGMTGYLGQAWYGLTAALPLDARFVEVGSVVYGPEISGAQAIIVTFSPKTEQKRLTIPALTTP